MAGENLLSQIQEIKSNLAKAMMTGNQNLIEKLSDSLLSKTLLMYHLSQYMYVVKPFASINFEANINRF